MRRAATIVTGVVGAALLLPGGGAAQAGDALPRSAAMGGNYTALARGFSAVLWNPAGLAMPDNPRASFTLLPFAVNAGLRPISYREVTGYDDELIPHDTRVAWLDQIRSEGGQAGRIGSDLTYLAISVGRVGLSASSRVRGRMNVGPDVAELLLFGNAGLTGDPRDYTLGGSHLDAVGTTTLAASVGHPIRLAIGPLPDQHFAVGVTLKYTMGHFLVMGEERNSSLTTDPLEVHVQLPIIHTHFPDDDEDASFLETVNNGGGLGLDIGAAWQAGIFAAGVTIRNLVNTFEWKTENLRYRAGTAAWTADSAYTSFDDEPFGQAPADLVDRLDRLFTFAPVLTAGGAARVLPYLTVTGEVRHALEDNLDVGERSHLGVGGELTILPVLPLRAGVAVVSGGYQLSAGLGVRLAGLQLSVAGAYRQGDVGSDLLGAIGLTFDMR